MLLKGKELEPYRDTCHASEEKGTKVTQQTPQLKNSPKSDSNTNAPAELREKKTRTGVYR